MNEERPPLEFCERYETLRASFPDEPPAYSEDGHSPTEFSWYHQQPLPTNNLAPPPPYYPPATTHDSRLIVVHPLSQHSWQQQRQVSGAVCHTSVVVEQQHPTYETYRGHVILACVAALCFGVVFGCIALILAGESTKDLSGIKYFKCRPEIQQ
jgi:hypothetical protein